MHSLNTFGVRTSHGQPRTHKTHHNSDLWEIITSPLIVFYAALHGGHIQMAFCLGTPKWESFRSPKIPTTGSPAVATPLWPSVGVKPNTSKVGDLEFSGTPECLKFDSKAQNTSHWGVFGVIGKVLKRRYRKWPRIGHLDICSPSYGQKKGRESNWQFDSRPLKVGNRRLPDLRIKSAIRRWKDRDVGYKFGSDLVAIRRRSRELWSPKVPGLRPGQFRDNFGTPTRESRESREKKWHSGVGAAKSRRVYYRGVWWWHTPEVRAVVCLVVQSARGLSQHPRVSRNVN